MATKQKTIPANGKRNSDRVAAKPNSIEELLSSAERLGFSKSEINALNANYAKVYSSFLQ